MRPWRIRTGLIAAVVAASAVLLAMCAPVALADAVPTEASLLRSLLRPKDFGANWSVVTTNGDSAEAGSNFTTFDGCGTSPERPVAEVGEVATSPKGLDVGIILGRMAPGVAASTLERLRTSLPGCPDRFTVLAPIDVGDQRVVFTLADDSATPRHGFAVFFSRGDVLCAVVVFHQDGTPKLTSLSKYARLTDARVGRFVQRATGR